MKYKVGDKVRVKKNADCFAPYKGMIGLIDFCDSITNTYTLIGIDTCPVVGWKEHKLEPVSNRSKVGKKAYRTFIKNGGSRNSKGQFSKKQKIDWEKIGKDLDETFWRWDELVHEVKMVKRFAKVFQKHGLISKEERYEF